MKVAIVGGGIGGLTLAAALRDTPWEVTVVERCPEFPAVGAGIVIGANATACLASLGLGEALAAAGRRLRGMEVANCTQRLSGMSMEDLGAPTYTLHRGALHGVLQRGLGEARTVMDATVEALEAGGRAGGGARVTLTTGEVAEFDLVVGADGIASRVRELAFAEHNPEIVYAGYTCWRALVQGERERVLELWGRGRRVGLVPLRDGQLYVFLTRNAPPGTPESPTDPAALAEEFSPFGEETAAAVRQLAHTKVLHHDITYLARHVWIQGPVALLGDAAHAFTPNMGQGAGMAIEDATVLGGLLKDLSGPEELAGALVAYRDARRARVKWVSDTSYRIGALTQWENGALRWMRDVMTRWTPDAIAARTTHQLWAGAPVHPDTAP